MGGNLSNLGLRRQLSNLAASGQSQQIEGLVVISASQLDAAFRLPKIIAELRCEEPLISIEVIVTNEPSNFRPTQNDLIAKKLREEVIRLYGAPLRSLSRL